MGRIDESCRKRFEAARRAGDEAPLSRFLPDPAEATYHATLEELVLIDMEFRWKAWHASGVGKRPPTLSDYQARHPHLAARQTRERMEAELQWLARSATPDGSTQIDRYRLEEHIGTGAFADVWRAHDPKLGRDVALKIPNSMATADPRLLERVQREAQAAGSLDHPGVLSVHAIGEHEGRPFYVSEYVPGRTLGTRFREGALDVDELASIVAAIARATAYAHASGIVHRDIKPSNILMHPVRGPVLADFGLAQLGAAASTLTQEGDVLGTPAYMAPEQATGRVHDIDARTDVYALGVVLYEGLTGRRPFERGSSAATIQALLSEDPVRPSIRRPGIPVDIETICLKAMARERDRRYASADDLVADLERFLARQPVSARPVGVVGRAALWTRRRPALAGMAATALVLVAVVATWGYLGIRAERDQLQVERDKTRHNLYRALVSDAANILEAGRAGWPERAQARLREAAALDVDTDPRPLRDLAIRSATAHGPTLSVQDVWPGDGARLRKLGVHAARERVFEVTESGELRARSLATGRVLARVPAPSDGLVELLVDVDHDQLLLVYEQGRIVTWGLEPLSQIADIDIGPLEAAALHPRGDVIALARSTGHVDLHRWETGRTTARLPHLAAHESRCRSLAFSPDGTWLVTGGGRSGLKLWDWALGICVQAEHGVAAPPLVVTCETAVADEAPHFAGATSVDFTPKQVTSGATGIPQNEDWSHGARILGMAYMQPWLVTAAVDGSMAVWASRARTHLLAEPGSRGRIDAVAFLPDQRELLTAHADGAVCRWRVGGSAARRWPTQHGCAFRPGTPVLYTSERAVDHAQRFARPTRHEATTFIALLGDPDTSSLLGIHTDGRVVRLSDQPPFDTQSVWQTGLDKVRCAARQDGWLALGSARGTVWLGRLQGTVVEGAVVPLDGGPVRSVQADPDGGFLVLDRRGLVHVATGGAIRRLDPAGERTEVFAVAGTRRVRWSRARGLVLEENGTTRVLDTPVDAPRHLALSTDGRWLSDGGRSRTVIRALPSGEVHYTVPGSARRRAWFLPDDRRLLYSDPLTIVDVETRRWHAHSKLWQVEDVAVDARRKRWFASDHRAGVWSWSFEDLEATGSDTPHATPLLPPGLQLTDGAHAHSVWGVDISPDGRWLVTCDHWGFVKLWDLETRRVVRTLRPEAGLAWVVRFAPDSRSFAVGLDRAVHWIDLATGTTKARFDGHERLVVGVAFHPHEPWLVSSALDRTLRVWDLETTRAMRTHELTAVARALDMHPDGSTLALGLSDGLVQVLPTAGRIERLTPTFSMQAHPTEAYAVRFDPRGHLLATGGADGRVVLHEADSGETLCTLRGTRNVRSLSWSEDGRFLAAGSYVAMSTSWDVQALRTLLRELDVDWNEPESSR